MRVLLINAFCGIGSTGRICTDIARRYEKEGHKVKIAYGRHENVPKQFEKYAIRIGNYLDVRIHGLMTRIFDLHGFFSTNATRKFLKWVDEFKPDLVWLHNIHGYYINIELLFKWIKKQDNLEVKWTLHDCWSFTGHCSYFTLVKCDKWKKKCYQCPQKKEYPASLLFDNSEINFEKKKELFCGIRNMTLITPSNWLADLVKQSFLKEYPIEVIYNTIDTNIFKPTSSNFREKYGIQDKKIILGVANVWDKRKGLDDFYKLATMLNDEFVIVLVGLTPKQIKEMPKKIIGLRRTNDVHDLVAIYSAADIFVNPSKEEVFGMTTIEATACGTEAIVYEGTACAEVVRMCKGVVVQQGVKNIFLAIINKVGYKVNAHTGGTIICIPRTNSPRELAEIYSSVDIFVNPTYEDNYPTVNLEAIACGTWVITYDTGGSMETLLYEP